MPKKSISKQSTLWGSLRNDRVDHTKEHNAERIFASERGGAILLLNGNIMMSFDLHNKIIEEIKTIEENNLEVLPNSYLEQKYIEFQNDSSVKKAAQHHNLDLTRRPIFYPESSSRTPSRR